MWLRFAIPPALALSLIALLWYNADSEAAPQRRQARVLNVLTEEVQSHQLNQQLNLIGTLDAARSVEIAAEVNAKVEALPLTSNQSAQKGELLIQLDATKAMAQLNEARAFHQDEQRKLGEYQLLLSRKAISQAEYDAQKAATDIALARLDVAKAELEDYSLRAPFDGVIGLIDISEGSLVNANQGLLSFDDLSKLHLDLNVPERYLSQLQIGMPIQATSSAWPGRHFSGEMQAIDPRVDSDSLNLRVRIAFDNPEQLLKPGMLLSATLALPTAEQPMVPVQAIEYSGTRRYVYVIDQQQTAVRTEVELGQRIDNAVLIQQGLQGGERIVVQGLVNIRDGAKVDDLALAAEGEPSERQRPAQGARG